MKNSKKKTKVVLLILLVIMILVMTIAFALTSSTLNIRGTGKVEVDGWDIRFENLQRATIGGTAEETRAPTIKNSTTIEEYAVVLKASGDFVTYNFDVHNYGDIDAEISELVFPERPICTGLATSNEQKIADAELVQRNIRYTLKYVDTGESVKSGDKLLASETKNLTLSIGYYGEELPTDRVSISGLGITITYSQASTSTPEPEEDPTVSTISISTNSGNTSANSAFLGGPITRENIEKIEFVSASEKPTTSTGSWDIASDGNIKAYYTQSSTNSSRYNVVICPEKGTIQANNSSSYIFANLTNLKELNLSNFMTTDSTNVQYMCNNCSNLENVIIGDKVKKIDWYAFFRCSKLKTAKLGENVTEIGQYAFEYCIQLETVETGDKIERIGIHAFNHCEKMQRIHYSTSLKEIGKAAFQYCYALQNIDLPEGLKRIGQFAFNHNRGLTCSTIRIPSTVEVIGNYYYPAHMFYDCGQENGNFVAFEVPEESQYYKAVDGILYTKDGKTLVSIPRNKTFENNTYIMPDEVELLGELCFNRNKNINRVVISDNLIINDDTTSEQRAAGWVNFSNSLAVGIYLYTNVTHYDVKDTNTHYTTGNKIIKQKNEYGDKTSAGYLLTADGTTLVAVPPKCLQYQMLPSTVTTIRKNAFYMYDSVGENFVTADGMYSNVHFRIHANTINIEDRQLKFINWLAKNATVTLETQGENSKYQIVDNQYVER